MTWEELEKIESLLKENGYRNGGKPYHCNADYYWYKAFGKCSSMCTIGVGFNIVSLT